MKPRANCVTEWPINALSVFLPGLPVATTAPDACAGDNGAITLSPGFCATVFADKLGHARHLVVAANGVVYANTWSGRYYHDDTPPPGGFLIALQDTKGDGRADKIVRRFLPRYPLPWSDQSGRFYRPGRRPWYPAGQSKTRRVAACHRGSSARSRY